ncbi:MAG TPA: hypothetical protein VHL09_04545 [Dehalococcoidia bacterium]|nr:hypothetical protein [Dehalococcoidia bacterium]
MRRIRWFAFLGALFSSLILPASTLAGGWSVVAAYPLPAAIGAGDETTLGFMVLQHGRTPLPGQRPEVTAVHESGERVTAVARAEGAPGHYVATLSFSQPGAWAWSVTVFEGPHQMAPLTVQPAGAGATPTASGSTALVSLDKVLRNGLPPALTALIFSITFAAFAFVRRLGSPRGSVPATAEGLSSSRGR